MGVSRTALPLSVALTAWMTALAASQAPPQLPPTATPQPAAPAQGRGAQPQQLPILPVAVSAILNTPDTYVGRTVTLTAAVEQRFGANVFSIDQDAKKTSAEIVVLAPVLTAPLEPNNYVTVIGEVVRFEEAAIAAKMKDAMPPLSADLLDKFRGRPAIVATSVINNAMTDLAKRLPPPMTPEEAALSKQMKQIGPGFNALRQAVTASNAEDVRAHALTLNKAFAEAAAFWKTKTHPDALQWNEDAKRESDAIATAMGKNDWDTVKASVPKLQSTCASCHGQYRERLDDGTYRYRQPTK
jgi:cytochrome c556